ncbi:hypothetical protein [Mycoplasmopsis fermentans]|nr:hypothetical protein [Mycoplasmopsis fermentans]AAT65033.1 hypothetical protein [Mycoplasma phage phiMFV1]VEU67388.1 Uncharacterised protein [Mesomycoplasma conjunctivae]AAT65054.1 hypothetical protein [Mycoplasma phage phiMFV1]ADV34592.1 Chain length regulator (Capsular polysaccharide biosynthesis) [Mycoplasmopsis fermentans M64]RMX34470.1 PMC2NT domain protein [Mycoplasmopsis fermentans MF-I2]
MLISEKEYFERNGMKFLKQTEQRIDIVEERLWKNINSLSNLRGARKAQKEKKIQELEAELKSLKETQDKIYEKFRKYPDL